MAVRREGDGVRVETSDGSEFRGERLINTLPMDVFCKLTDPTESEAQVADAIDWGGYTTSLLSVADWPHEAPVNSWSDTCATDANDGQILFSRYECPDEMERDLFTVGQLSSAYSLDELTELALFSARDRGAIDPRMMQQIVWSYMPTYKAEAVRNGLLSAMSMGRIPAGLSGQSGLSVRAEVTQEFEEGPITRTLVTWIYPSGPTIEILPATGS